MREGPFQFFGAATGPLIVTLLILAVSLFLGLAVYPTISYNVLPLQVINQIAAAGTIIFLWCCNLMDPGTVFPSNDEAPPLASGENYATRYLPGPNPDQPEEQRWCRTCQLWRPPRASHCRTCDRCFLRFDHHCIWIGNCVALGTMRWFILFLFFASLGCVLGSVATILAIAELNPGNSEAWSDWRIYFFIAFLVFPCPPVVGLLFLSLLTIPFMMQMFMLAGGVTTKERVRHHRRWFDGGKCCEDLAPVCSSSPQLRWSAKRKIDAWVEEQECVPPLLTPNVAATITTLPSQNSFCSIQHEGADLATVNPITLTPDRSPTHGDRGTGEATTFSAITGPE
mmetsp:Transcript_66636/g.118254  ORF Transcript_66636/g.118254 Transcript_66636/m.118254 type:complete len:340 (-) Transcript_66636:82-1101(-)